MATPYTTGAVLVHVRPTTYPAADFPSVGALGGSTGAARFLGTAEVSPQQEIQRETDLVFNDLSGKVPLDIIFVGEHAFITMDLTRWNESTHAILAHQPNSFRGTTIPGRGTYNFADVGALLMHEGLGIELILTFSRVTPTSVYAAQGMPPGYRFPMAAFTGPDRHHQMGSRAKKIHLTFHAIPLISPTGRRFSLYDHAIPTGLPFN